MKVNIVTEGSWIKRFWSDKIIEYNQSPIEYSLSYVPIQDADVNFYICYNVFLPFGKTKALDVGYVTHIHANDPIAHSRDIGMDFNKFRLMDGWVHQSQRSLKQFLGMGFPAEKNFNLTSAVETHKFIPTITIGIFQNGEVVGKGLFFMKELVEQYDLTNFKFIFCGKGWEQVTQIMDKKGIRYETHTYTQKQYHDVEHKVLYERINYLLVPSLWEGGPVAPQEAMACGIPIISSDVGFIPEFNVEHMFPAGNVGALIEILKNIENNILKTRSKVIDMSYTNYSNKLYTILKQIKGE
jgi:glycosyltransferase involved in cell wall biosynthesis